MPLLQANKLWSRNYRFLRKNPTVTTNALYLPPTLTYRLAGISTALIQSTDEFRNVCETTDAPQISSTDCRRNVVVLTNR